MNLHIIHGRLGRDPKLTFTTSGMACAEFSVATDDRKKDGDNWVKVVDWINCKAWGKNAENIYQFFVKGSEIVLYGKQKTRSWDGKDGNKNYKTETVIDRWEFAGNKEHADSTDTEPEPPNPAGSNDADLPF